ncbi:MAG: CapA family protein [Lachnospiraceae bacterium]
MPDDAQKTLAHLAIDQGADLVVGHHPHVLQGIEKYQGKKYCIQSWKLLLWRKQESVR